MDNLYRDFILEHYREPHNKGVLDPHDLHFADSNPTCGDEMSMTLLLDDAKERVARRRLRRAGLRDQPGIGLDPDRRAARHEPSTSSARSIPGRSSRTSACRSAPPGVKCALLSYKVLQGAVSGAEARWPDEAEVLAGGSAP